MTKKKGWVPARQAQQQAQAAHRAARIKQARKGKAAPPEYRETSTGLLGGLLRRRQS